MRRLNDLKRLARSFGFEATTPFDNEINLSLSDRYQIAAQICSSNYGCIALARAVIANVSPFRGPHMDAGTAAECGYAFARDIPVFAWTCDSRSLAERAQAWIPEAKRSSCVEGRDHSRRLIENFGLVENLMIDIPAGRIYRNPGEALLACANALNAAPQMAEP